MFQALRLSACSGLFLIISCVHSLWFSLNDRFILTIGELGREQIISIDVKLKSLMTLWRRRIYTVLEYEQTNLYKNIIDTIVKLKQNYENFKSCKPWQSIFCVIPYVSKKIIWWR